MRKTMRITRAMRMRVMRIAAITVDPTRPRGRKQKQKQRRRSDDTSLTH